LAGSFIRLPSLGGEGCTAGSGVLEATISAAPKRLGGAVQGEITKELSSDISQK
jgi:hypothetical protein